MIGLASGSQDPDLLIDVLDHRTLYPPDYVTIVGALLDSNRRDDAKSWAEQGIEDWQSRPGQLAELRRLLADILRERGEGSRGVEMFWEGFKAEPSLSSYRDLLAQAGQDSEVWADRCLDLLRKQIVEYSEREANLPDWAAVRPSRVLTEILVYEGETDGAWTVASEHGAHDSVWWTLAKAREEKHPLDSIEVYEREVFAHIQQKKRRSYRDAVALLAHIERLAKGSSEPERFRMIIERVRAEHGAKWTLMEMLDRKKW